MKYLGIIITIAIILIVAYIYNVLKNARNKVRELYTKVNLELKKRWDLIPNLVEFIKNDSIFEEKTLKKLDNLRNQDYSKFELEQKINVDNNMSKVVKKIIGMAENSSELNSNEDYINLSNQLVKLDDEISKSKEEYNKLAKEYNTQIEIKPNNLVAIMFGFNEAVEFN